MALKFEDFTKTIFSFKELPDVLREMNDWIEKKNIRVINVETLYAFAGTLNRQEIGYRLWYISN